MTIFMSKRMVITAGPYSGRADMGYKLIAIIQAGYAQFCQESGIRLHVSVSQAQGYM